MNKWFIFVGINFMRKSKVIKLFTGKHGQTDSVKRNSFCFGSCCVQIQSVILGPLNFLYHLILFAILHIIFIPAL